MENPSVKEILGGKEDKRKAHPPKRKKAKHPRTIIDHLDDDSHVITHEQHPPEDGSKPPENIKYSARDLDELHDGLERHLGEPNVGEEAAGV